MTKRYSQWRGGGRVGRLSLGLDGAGGPRVSPATQGPPRQPHRPVADYKSTLLQHYCHLEHSSSDQWTQHKHTGSTYMRANYCARLMLYSTSLPWRAQFDAVQSLVSFSFYKQNLRVFLILAHCSSQLAHSIGSRNVNNSLAFRNSCIEQHFSQSRLLYFEFTNVLNRFFFKSLSLITSILFSY